MGVREVLSPGAGSFRALRDFELFFIFGVGQRPWKIKKPTTATSRGSLFNFPLPVTSPAGGAANNNHEFIGCFYFHKHQCYPSEEIGMGQVRIGKGIRAAQPPQVMVIPQKRPAIFRRPTAWDGAYNSAFRIHPTSPATLSPARHKKKIELSFAGCVIVYLSTLSYQDFICIAGLLSLLLR
jgi:hypothetical protein